MSSNAHARELDFVQCYRQTGLFFSANFLRAKGLRAPARVAVVLGRALAEAAEGRVPPRETAQGAEAYVATSLEWIVARHPGIPTGGRFDCFVDDVNRRVRWDGYSEFAELLNTECGPKSYESVRRRLRSRGVPADVSLLQDIAVGFVENELPRAVRSFDLAKGNERETAWLATVFYRYALARVLAQRSADVNLDVLGDVVYFDSGLEQVQSQEFSGRIAEALSTLDERFSLPLRLFFGFDGHRAMAVRHVAQHLGTTDYRARLRIVRGLAAVAAHLNTPGVLDKRELNVAREMFLGGVPLDVAAKRLQLTSAQVRASVASLQAKLVAGLKEIRIDSSKPTRRNDMFEQPKNPRDARKPRGVHSDWKRVVDDLIRSGGQVDTQVTDAGVYQATVDDVTFNVEAFIVAIREQPELQNLLESTDLDLGWLITPPVHPSRNTRRGEVEEWNRAIEALASRAWTVAESTYEQWQESLGSQALNAVPDRTETVDRILGALSAVLSGLQAELPRVARRAGHARLDVARRDDRVLATWDGATESVDLGALVRFSVGANGFTHQSGDSLAHTVTEGLTSGSLAIPGLSLVERTRDGVRLEWRAESIRLPALA